MTHVTDHIKFGDGLDVTDEGGGVIRVDANGGPPGPPGSTGPPGPIGGAGPPGIGVPGGGTTGEVLTKDSDTEFDTSWQPTGGIRFGVENEGGWLHVLTEPTDIHNGMELKDVGSGNPYDGIVIAEVGEGAIRIENDGDGVPYHSFGPTSVAIASYGDGKILIHQTGGVSGDENLLVLNDGDGLLAIRSTGDGILLRTHGGDLRAITDGGAIDISAADATIDAGGLLSLYGHGAVVGAVGAGQHLTLQGNFVDVIGTSAIWLRLEGPSAPLVVLNASLTTIFRIDQDGTPHCRVGKTLVADL